MIRQIVAALTVLVFAGALLGGCRSQPQEEPPPVVDPPDVTPTPPPERPEAPPRVDDNGNPIQWVGGEPVPLNRTFYFEYDQARLAQADIRVLAMHAEFLRDFRDRSVRVEGHCDERGSREYNLALGERRAEAVRRYLVSAGVRSTQIQTVSFGEERPVDPGHDEGAWAKNRRAVMIYRPPMPN